MAEPYNILIEIAALIPETGLTETIRMSSRHAQSAGVEVDGKRWLPLVTSGPVFGVSRSENGEPKPLDVSYGSISFAIGVVFSNLDWSKYAFEGSLATIWIGKEGDAFASYRQIWSGILGPLERQNDREASVILLGQEANLQRPLLSASYAGTGNAEGPASLTGKLKPYVMGAATNVEPVLIDATYWVFQYHGYGSCPVNAVYSNALTLGAPKYTSTNYAGLLAQPLQPGEWGIAPEIGMFRLGADPNGAKITADVGSATTVGPAVRSMLLAAGISIDKIGASVAAATTVNGSPANYSNYITQQVTVFDVAREATLWAHSYLIADTTGTFHIAPHNSARPVTVLTSNRSTRPLVITDGIRELINTSPAWKVRVGHTRVFATHDANEISPAVAELGAQLASNAAAIEAAQEAADLAAADATFARERVENQAKDSKIDRTEKINLAKELAELTAEYPRLLAEAQGRGVSTTDYTNKWNALNTHVATLALSNLSNDATIVPATHTSRYNEYYAARSALRQAVSTSVNGGITTANTIATAANSTATYANVVAVVANSTANQANSTANQANSTAVAATNALRDPTSGSLYSVDAIVRVQENFAANVPQLQAAAAWAQNAASFAAVAQAQADAANAAQAITISARDAANAAQAIAQSARDATQGYLANTVNFSNLAQQASNAAAAAQVTTIAARDAAQGHLTNTVARANDASNSANAAALARTASETARNIANNHANTAQLQANAATAAKTLAEQAQTGSQTARDAANAHAGNASTSANTASQQAILASGAASNSGQSAGAALAHSTNASTSANAAQQQANIATQQAIAAQTANTGAAAFMQQAANASNSANAAMSQASTSMGVASNAALAANNSYKAAIPLADVGPVNPAQYSRITSNGSPETVGDWTGNTAVNANGELAFLLDVDGVYAAWKKVLPATVGRTYRFELDAESINASGRFQVYPRFLNSSYTGFTTFPASGTTVTARGRYTMDVTLTEAIAGGQAWMRPSAKCLGSEGGIRLYAMRVYDVTELLATQASATSAAGFSAAANSAANTAGQQANAATQQAAAANTSRSDAQSFMQQAGNASNSANAASANATLAAGTASQAASQALVTASKLFPDRYDSVGGYFTAPSTTGNGNPTAVDDLPSNAMATGYGPVRSETLTGNGNWRDFASKHVLPAIPGRIYKIEVEFQRTALTGTAGRVDVSIRGADAAWANMGGATVGYVTTSGNVQVHTGYFSSFTDASRGIVTWPTGSVWLRPYSRYNCLTTGSETVQFRRLTVTDVTETMAAAASSAAAQTFSNQASNSAIAANSSASAASISAGTASNSAVAASVATRLLFPSTFDNDGEYFTTQGGGKNPAPLTSGEGFFDIAGEGRVWRTAPAGGGSKHMDLMPRQALALLPNRRYRFTAKVRQIVDATDGAGGLNGFGVWFHLDSDYNRITTLPAGMISVGIAGYRNGQQEIKVSDGWQLYGHDLITGPAPSPYFRPMISFNRPNTGKLNNGQSEISWYKVEDITESFSAANSSALALTYSNQASNSASTATGAASSAILSMGAAANSAVASLNILNSGPLLPFRVAERDNFLQNITADAFTDGTIVNVSGEGDVIQIVNTRRIIVSRGLTTAGTNRIFRVTARWRTTVDAAIPANNDVFLGFFGFSSTGAYLSNIGWGARGVGARVADGWVEHSVQITSAQTGSAPFIRPGIATNSNGTNNSGATSQIAFLRIEDVTESEAAKASSAAAAGFSASANNSANAAQQQANSATGQAALANTARSDAAAFMQQAANASNSANAASANATTQSGLAAQARNDASNSATAAQSSAASANAASNAAASSASASANSALVANSHRGDAANSASAAALSNVQAASNATTSQQWANASAASALVANAGATTAGTFAQQASNASNSANSASSNATTAQGLAAQARNDASNSATAAQSSAASASAASNAAASSANASANSALVANSHRGEAANSATAAALSNTRAESNATTARQWANASANSALVANAGASTAGTFAQQASNASNTANAASASATLAQGITANATAQAVQTAAFQMPSSFQQDDLFFVDGAGGAIVPATGAFNTLPPASLTIIPDAAWITANPALIFNRTSGATHFGPNGALTTVPANTPRLNHYYADGRWQPSGIMAELSRANLIRQSLDVSNAAWTKSAMTVTSTAGAGLGGGTGMVITSTGQYAQARQLNLTVAANTQYTLSAIVKPVTGTVFSLLVTHTGAASYANYNLTTGAVVASTGAQSTRIAPVGDGFWRVEMTFATPADVTAITPTLWVNMYNADNTSGQSFVVAGAQLESGSIGSSLIATTTGTATRAAERLTQVLGQEYNGTAMTALLRVRIEVLAPATQVIWQIDNGASTNRIMAYASSSNRLTFQWNVAGAASVTVAGPILAANTNYNIAVSFDLSTNSLKFAVDGTVYERTFTGSFLPFTTRRWGCAENGGSQAYGSILPYLKGVSEVARMLTAEEILAFTKP